MASRPSALDPLTSLARAQGGCVILDGGFATQLESHGEKVYANDHLHHHRHRHHHRHHRRRRRRLPPQAPTSRTRCGQRGSSEMTQR